MPGGQENEVDPVVVFADDAVAATADLVVSLLRAAGVPARFVPGVVLPEDHRSPEADAGDAETGDTEVRVVVPPTGSVAVGAVVGPASQRDRLEQAAALVGRVAGTEMLLDRLGQRMAELESRSLVDDLTGVGNRRAWEVGLDQFRRRRDRSGHEVVAAMIDLDGLKAVNDDEGHLAGDVRLRMAAEALRAALRSDDLLARVGGDEFAVLAEDEGGTGEESLRSRLRSALDGAGVAASVGVASTDASRDLLATVAEADRRMYAAKRALGAARRR